MATNNEIKYEYESDANNKEDSKSDQEESVKGDVFVKGYVSVKDDSESDEDDTSVKVDSEGDADEDL